MDFTAEIGTKMGIPERSLTSMVSLGGLERLDTQDCACLGFTSGFTFPLEEERRRASDRLAELRDGNIGSFALGDTFGPDFGGFRGR